MRDADMVIAISNVDGNVTLSHRDSRNERAPSVSSIQSGLTLVANMSGPITNSSSWAITFLRDKTADGYKDIVNGTQNFIWAYGSSNVSSNDVNAAIGYHGPHRKSVSGNLLAPNSSFTGDDGAGEDDEEDGEAADFDKNVQLHGALMFVAWGFLAPLGILIARFGKNKMGVWWFRAHVFLLFIGVGVLTIYSFVLIYKVADPDHFLTDVNIHPVLGLAVFVACLTQFVQGFIIDRLFKPARKTIPWYDQLHWWLGRATLIAAWVNIPIGLDNYNAAGTVTVSTNYYYAYYCWIGFIVVGFVLLQIFVGGTKHQEQGMVSFADNGENAIVARGVDEEGNGAKIVEIEHKKD
ncbi:hypothetical protein HDU76_002577 [Blyttiomyces sp. JEL0837]|nr:hypothetical protein HDU76_002577 [Blyttiomyces sp. JEL0837]